ncbi:hypothetical protein XENOCAPTIV_014916 [Xenoophorus captivus]|uniref:Uncharacterized protein n=1 Tax=Xenoophorus captivus TaxID=1517983 RepID=A0ABV0Q9Z8_9TELE
MNTKLITDVVQLMKEDLSVCLHTLHSMAEEIHMTRPITATGHATHFTATHQFSQRPSNRKTKKLFVPENARNKKRNGCGGEQTRVQSGRHRGVLALPWAPVPNVLSHFFHIFSKSFYGTLPARLL